MGANILAQTGPIRDDLENSFSHSHRRYEIEIIMFFTYSSYLLSVCFIHSIDFILLFVTAPVKLFFRYVGALITNYYNHYMRIVGRGFSQEGRTSPL